VQAKPSVLIPPAQYFHIPTQRLLNLREFQRGRVQFAASCLQHQRSRDGHQRTDDEGGEPGGHDK